MDLKDILKTLTTSPFSATPGILLNLLQNAIQLSLAVITVSVGLVFPQYFFFSFMNSYHFSELWIGLVIWAELGVFIYLVCRKKKCQCKTTDTVDKTKDISIPPPPDPKEKEKVKDQ